MGLTLLLTACSQPAVTSDQSTGDSGTPIAQQTAQEFTDYKPRLNGNATVEMVVNGKPIIIEVDGENAPITAGNFIDFVR